MKKLLLAASLLVSVLAISQPKQKSSTKYKLTDIVPRSYIKNYDSLADVFMCTEIIKKLNAIRKTKGMKPLIVDARLAPAAYHHAIYLDYVHDHKILSGEDDDNVTTMTHSERYDIPGFNEILDPWDRIKLLQPSVFRSITEELTGIGSTIQLTYDQVTTNTLNYYKACSAHWTSLTTNPNYDAVFMFITHHGVVVTILGDYF
jgi:hypothetical protein